MATIITTTTNATTANDSTEQDNEQNGEDYLLKMLEEQNRMLEQDTRYTQKISRSESNAASGNCTTATNTINNPQMTPPTPSPHPVRKHVTTTTDAVTPTVDEEQVSDEEELLSVWANVLKNWEENVKKNNKLIKQLVKKGIPDPLRGMAWQLLSGPHNEYLRKMYPSLITQEACPFEKQIRRDLDRTFPDHPYFKDRDGAGQESLLSVMKAYSLYDREVGYCQGSLFLAGELLIHMPEEETFCVLIQLMNKYKLRELYKPSMAKLSICFYQFENLLEELYPKLNIHFKALGFYTSMYSSSWFLTLFASTLSLNIAFRIMDIFLEEGLEIVFRIGLALMEHSHDELMSMDLEEMTKLLQKGVKSLHESNPEELFDRAFKIKLSSKKLKKLEKEYLMKKEKQATENSNLILLRDENEDLEKRVMALEMECAALADRLIQGQVTRAQEAEELFIARRDVSRLRKEVKALKDEKDILNCYPSSPNQTLLEIKEKDRSISAPSLRENSVSVPTTPNGPDAQQHVSREEAQQCLRELGISPTTTPTTKPPTPTTKPTVNKLPIPPQSQSPELETTLQELATTKILHAETLHSLELKSLELKKALQREKDVRDKLEQARATVESLKHKEETLHMPSVCPQCGFSYSSLKESQDDDQRSSCPSQNEEENIDYSGLLSSLKTPDMLSEATPTTATPTTVSPSLDDTVTSSNNDSI